MVGTFVPTIFLSLQPTWKLRFLHSYTIAKHFAPCEEKTKPLQTPSCAQVKFTAVLCRTHRTIEAIRASHNSHNKSVVAVCVALRFSRNCNFIDTLHYPKVTKRSISDILLFAFIYRNKPRSSQEEEKNRCQQNINRLGRTLH